MSVDSAELMAVSVPLTTTIPVPFPETVSPVVELNNKVPLGATMLNCSAALFVSLALMAFPPKKPIAPPSIAFTEAGAVTTGAVGMRRTSRHSTIAAA